MSNDITVRISELPNAVDPDGNEIFPVVQGGVTRRMRIDQLDLGGGDLILASDFGVTSSADDQSAELNAFAASLDESKIGYIDVDLVGVGAPVLFNNGFKKVFAAAGFRAVNLMNESVGTERAMFNVNMTSSGIPTNRTTGPTITTNIAKGENIVTVNSTASLQPGQVICLGTVTCQIAEILSATEFKIDRDFPYTQNGDNPLSEFTTVDILTKPNIGSEFSLGTVDGNGTIASPRYGFGVRVAHCFKFKAHTVHGINFASKVFQDTRCTDSEFSDMSGVQFTDVEAGHGYVYRGANCLDNTVRRIRGTNHRHVVDITFGHRTKVYNCKASKGEKADFLTHFNGCSYVDFIDCDIYYGKEGYGSLSDPIAQSGESADYANRVIGGTVYNSRVSSREVNRGKDSTQFRGVRIIAEGQAASAALFVPGYNGAVFNLYDCIIDSDKALVFGDVAYRFNFYGGTYTNRRNFGMSNQETTAAASFYFENTTINVELALGRRNPSNDIEYRNCIINCKAQPWQEDAGNIRVFGGWAGYPDDIQGSNFFLPIWSNDCTVADVTLSNIKNIYRFYTGQPSGIIRVGNNTLINGSVYTILNNLTWTNVGELEIFLGWTDSGTPLDGTRVKVSNWNDTGVRERIRVDGAWQDHIIGGDDLTAQINSKATLIADFVRNQHRVYKQYGLTDKAITDVLDTTRASTATYDSPFGVATAGVNEPRITYDPETGKCLGLLSEESRTNLLLWSEDFSQTSAWSFTASKQASNGRLIETNDNEVQAVTQPITVGSPRAVSIYLTDITTDAVIVAYFTNSTSLGTNRCGVSYDPVTGDVGSFALGSTNISNVESSKFFNGVKITFTTTEHSPTFIVGFNRLTTPTYHGGAYQGDGVSGATVKVQVESGSFPTSYIPTGASAVTRGADNNAIEVQSGIQEWTVFVKVSSSARAASTPIVVLTNGAGNERVSFEYNSSRSLALFTRSAGTNVNTLSSLQPSSGFTGAFVFKGTSCKAFINGELAVSVTMAGIVSPDELLVGYRGGATTTAAFDSAKAVPRALTDAELIALTGGN